MIRKIARYSKLFFAYLIFLSFASLFAGSYIGKKLVFVNQVTDMDTKIPSQEALEQIAAGLPVLPETKKCFRAHQALFNEQVTCTAECGEYVQIMYVIGNKVNGDQVNVDRVDSGVSKIVYGFDSDTKKPLNTFWVKKEQVLLLDQIQDKEIEQVIPASEYAGKPTVVLQYPWNNFSVGTRFFHAIAQDTSDAYCVLYPNYNGMLCFDDTCLQQCPEYKKELLVIAYIPKKYALKEMLLKHESQVRIRFVRLINTLVDLVAELSDGRQVIPYVWGGSSFIWSHPEEESDFYQKDGVWHRWSKSNKQYTGYDCSQFVMRMAQIAGINFPWKTSWVIQEKKRALKEGDMLENGDLVWIPGHIMVVSDIENNELIEARGYGSGYGCVHRIAVSEFFDGIDTWQDLLAAYHAGKKVNRKDKSGAIVARDCEFKLLKLLD